MKNKYQRMSKEEKNILKRKFKEDSMGKEVTGRLNRLFIIGIIGIIISIIMFIVALMNKSGALDYVSSGILFSFSAIFLIGSIKIKGKELNKFALKQK